MDDNNISDVNLIELGLRIKEERESKGLTLQNVADRIGVVSSTIQRYETGNFSKVKIPVINAIAIALEVNPSWLLGKTENKHPIHNLKNNSSFSNEETIKINLYDKIPGNIHTDTSDHCVVQESVPMSWVNSDQEYIAIRVSGDSMYPKYINGDIVIIKMQSDFESGQDAIVSIDGYGETLKTLIKQEDGMVRLQPANPEFQPKVLKPENLKIIGIVKRLKRDF